MVKNNKTDRANGAHAGDAKGILEDRDQSSEPRWLRDARRGDLIVGGAFVLFCFWMMAERNGYMLRWYEEMSLFEGTRFFFRQCLYFPGGLMRYAGAWLTQLMYYPWLGSTAMIVLWLLTAWITQKAFRLPREAFPLTLVVPMAMLVSVVQIDDAWISMKSVGYMYSNTLSYLFVVATVWVYRAVEKRWMVAFVWLLIVVGCYFIAGFYALFAALIGVIFACSGISRKGAKGHSLNTAEKQRNSCGGSFLTLGLAAVVIIAILVTPNLYYMYFQPTAVDNDYLYLKGLPDLLMEKFDVYLWIPFIVATGWLLILAVASGLRWIPSSKWTLWGSVVVLVVCAGWSIRADKKNEQLRATVLMLNRLENNDWKGMIGIMSRIKEPPNYTMRVLNNYAVVNLGGESEDLSNIKQRNIDARHAEGFSMTAYVNIPINYYNGNFNVSYRWAMEHSVQYGKRVWFLKYMVKNALLNGEIELAKRYNNLLKRTLFHREWAEDMEKYIEDPSLIKENEEFRSILSL